MAATRSPCDAFLPEVDVMYALLPISLTVFNKVVHRREKYRLLWMSVTVCTFCRTTVVSTQNDLPDVETRRRSTEFERRTTTNQSRRLISRRSELIVNRNANANSREKREIVRSPALTKSVCACIRDKRETGLLNESLITSRYSPCFH